jgi:hypothetical protein
MNTQLMTIMGAGALLMLSFAQPTAAAVISPVTSNATDSNVIEARHRHHGWRGGGGFGVGVGGIGIGIGIAPRLYSPYYAAPAPVRCFYDAYGVRHCRRVYYNY